MSLFTKLGIILAVCLILATADMMALLMMLYK